MFNREINTTDKVSPTTLKVPNIYTPIGNKVNYKKLFLNKLKTSNGKNKYKRFLGSPLRYAGGKSLATGMIIELLPKNIKTLVSPFMGGGD